MHMREILEQQAHLVILKALTECNGEANESILESCLDIYGLKCSRDQVRSYICWLCEQGLVTKEEISGFYIVTITGRGTDAADGRTTVPGVKKPRPR